MDRDVVIVGAGVVGCAIARELTRFDLDVTLLEAGPDVGAGTSKANTALLHTGFDAKPGTLEARLVPRGCELLAEYAARVGIPVERTGALLVAWDEEQRAELPGIVERSRANGYDAIRELDAAELYAREPYLGRGAVAALEVPDEALVCPFTTPLAFATEAVLAGCDLRRSTPVTGVERIPGGFEVRTTGGALTTRRFVNAAGLRSDEIDRMLGGDAFTVTPRRGELIVFDKLSRPLVQHILLAVPTKVSKGVLVSATLLGHDVTAVYVGLRAATEHADFQIRFEDGYACVGGIRSTGLSASMAIAEYVRDGLELELRPRATQPSLKMPNVGEVSPRAFQRAELIARDPDYGRVVCLCERVTRGELRDAFASPIPPVDLDGLRRRTRAHMGRCQGFWCGAHLAALLAGEADA